ncbi:MAG: CRISPR-associated protein Cas5, partial [Candidatus Cloacimonadota bacterium]|nr:CRISPR-associated protein Cas5 [Candidatus Cloacimonadota bacterium]
MEALRIHLFQNKAHFRKEGTKLNKMTYPLPPFSTIIGALHVSCGLREYHEMDISVQGKFGTLFKQQYIDHCILDSTMNDRGILIKNINSDLHGQAYIKVAKALKSTGNNFEKKKQIQILNSELLDEYIQLKKKKREIDIFNKTRKKKVIKKCK